MMMKKKMRKKKGTNNGINEQVGSKIIQLLSLGKSDKSYKEDGQLRKKLSPILNSVGKPDSYSEEEGEILEKELINLQLANILSR